MTESSGSERPETPADLGPQAASTAPPPQRASEDIRKAALARQISTAVATQSARVESQGDYQAVLITGQKVNHVLHLLISIFTCGLWAIVWIALAVTGGEKRHLVQVDEWGNVSVQHL